MTADGRDAPAEGTVDCSAEKSDTVDLTKRCRGLYVGGDGDVKVTMLDGSTPTFSAVPAGTLLPICFTRVWSTGTSATLLVGLY